MKRNRQSSWRSLHQSGNSPISRIVFLVWILGASACSGSGDDSPTAPGGGPSPGSAVVYDVIGASDANGVGSSVVCPPYVDCPNGMGYAQIAARQLAAQGFTVSLLNLGIPAAVIGPDFQALGQQYGRTIGGNFIVQEMPFVRSNATLITIVAGGNEVNTITAALGGGAGGSNRAAYIDAQVRAFGDDYATLLTGIRARAPSARIIAANVPNLAGFPFLAGASLAQRQAAQRAAVRMSTTIINPLVSQNVTVVDMLCDTRMYQRSNISGDGFHPNDAGYTFIAGELVRAVTSSAYPVPLNSCASMSLVPDL
jgi:lysophospholipase L1-like esterase